MPKYMIEVDFDDADFRFVAECADIREAELRGRIDCEEGTIPQIMDYVRVHARQVPDDEPEGDR